MLAADALAARIAVELSRWDREYQLDLDVDGCRLTLADDLFAVHIEYICVPAGMRRAGYGTAMLSAVTGWADRNGEVLRLHMSVEYGTDQHVLSAFYGGRGFQPENRIGGMIREPVSVECGL